MSQGIFISLDGLDGAGKSTQCRLLAEWLRGQGHEVVPCGDPGGTAIGERIRELLLNRDMTLTCEALLFMASRAQLTAEIAPQEAAIKAAILETGAGAHGTYLQAIIVAPRITWDNQSMAVYSALHPDVLAYQTQN